MSNHKGPPQNKDELAKSLVTAPTAGEIASSGRFCFRVSPRTTSFPRLFLSRCVPSPRSPCVSSPLSLWLFLLLSSAAMPRRASLPAFLVLALLLCLAAPAVSAAKSSSKSHSFTRTSSRSRTSSRTFNLRTQSNSASISVSVAPLASASVSSAASASSTSAASLTATAAPSLTPSNTASPSFLLARCAKVTLSTYSTAGCSGVAQALAIASGCNAFTQGATTVNVLYAVNNNLPYVTIFGINDSGCSSVGVVTYAGALNTCVAQGATSFKLTCAVFTSQTPSPSAAVLSLTAPDGGLGITNSAAACMGGITVSVYYIGTVITLDGIDTQADVDTCRPQPYAVGTAGYPSNYVVRMRGRQYVLGSCVGVCPCVGVCVRMRECLCVLLHFQGNFTVPATCGPITYSSAFPSALSLDVNILAANLYGSVDYTGASGPVVSLFGPGAALSSWGDQEEGNCESGAAAGTTGNGNTVTQTLAAAAADGTTCNKYTSSAAVQWTVAETPVPSYYYTYTCAATPASSAAVTLPPFRRLRG